MTMREELRILKERCKSCDALHAIRLSPIIEVPSGYCFMTTYKRWDGVMFRMRDTAHMIFACGDSILFDKDDCVEVKIRCNGKWGDWQTQSGIGTVWYSSMPTNLLRKIIQSISQNPLYKSAEI